MTHRERLEIIEDIKHRILEKYGRDIEAIAIYGSVVRNADKEFSDIELWVATAEEANIPSRYFAYRDITVEIYFGTASDILDSASRVDAYWSRRIGNRRNVDVIHDKNDFERRLAARTQGASDKQFDLALLEQGTRLIELTGKLKNHVRHNNRYGLHLMPGDIVQHVTLLLGLLNKKHFVNDSISESRAFSLLPERYDTLIEAFFSDDDPSPTNKAKIAAELSEHSLAYVEGIIKRSFVETEISL